MRPDEQSIGSGYERGLRSNGPLGWYMRWYLRRRAPVEAPDVLNALGEGPADRVLDAGCGTGVWLEDFYRRGYGRRLLAGVEVSEMMALETHERLVRLVSAPTEVRIEHCSASEMPFAEESFDIVMANGMVKHLDGERFATFLADSFRMLAPGGRISVWDFGRALVRIPDVKVSNPALSLQDCTMRTGPVLAAALSDAGFVEARPYVLKRPWRMPVTLEGAAARRP